jgi:hypothetical protein
MGMILVPLAFFGFIAFGMPVGIAIGVAGMIGIFDMGPRVSWRWRPTGCSPGWTSSRSWPCRSSSWPARS